MPCLSAFSTRACRIIGGTCSDSPAGSTLRQLPGVEMYIGTLIWTVIYTRVTERRIQEERESHMQRAVHTAELRALEAQINPHFLFNSLNSIRGLVVEDPQKVQDMITPKTALGGGPRIGRIPARGNPQPPRPLAPAEPCAAGRGSSCIEAAPQNAPRVQLLVRAPFRAVSMEITSIVWRKLVARTPPPRNSRMRTKVGRRARLHSIAWRNRWVNPML